MSPRRIVTVALLEAIQAWDRLRLALKRWLLPGLEIAPGASSNLACARFALAPGARLVIGAGVVTERIPGALSFELGPGARVTIGEGTWLRTTLAPVAFAAFENARIEVGTEAFLNGCHLSAKRSVVVGKKANVGIGSRVFDADQHDLDDAHPERAEPVEIGAHAWVASDVTVLRGVTVGEHAVVGARSLVTRDVPPHTLAHGVPAVPRGKVGDRSNAR